MNAGLGKGDRFRLRRNISIVKNINNHKVVVIHEVRFRGKRKIAWKDVEKYLRRYIGEFYKMEDSLDVVNIGKDMPDEFCGSKDTARLKGTLAKAKANASQAIPELIEIAQNKRYQENLSDKHSINAKYGWYRYNSRFALPVYLETGDKAYYNIFRAEILVRCAADEKMYLYDIVNIKKETSTPLEL